MKNLQINKIKLTLFEIELVNVVEDKGGIGIRYSPNTTNKHLRLLFKFMTTKVTLVNMYLQEEEPRL